MSSSQRNITAFVVVLAAGIYFLRPSGGKPAGVDLALGPVATQPGMSPALKSLASAGKPVPRAPAAAAAKAATSAAQKSKSAINSVGPQPGRTEKEALVSNLHSTKKCYQSENCAFPKTDPRSYNFAVGRKIADELTQFEKKFAKDDPELARQLALEFANTEDGFVQEAALNLLGTVPPSQESLKAVAHVVTETTDPTIVQQAMDEMKRYVGTQEEAQVHQALARVLSTGGILTSQQASQGLMPFLNPSSVGYYQKVLRTLAPDSEVARNLRVSLQEYQRLSTGG